MRKKYLWPIAIVVIVIVLIWLIHSTNRLEEPFTPRIRAFYRPYVRHMNQYYDRALNDYGFQFIMNKLRKWNIY